TLTRSLSTKDLPEVDLLIRTSGELRVSNFLLWELAYSEFHITKTLWPDFRTPHFIAAVKDFQGRQRRFGGGESFFGRVIKWAHGQRGSSSPPPPWPSCWPSLSGNGPFLSRYWWSSLWDWPFGNISIWPMSIN